MAYDEELANRVRGQFADDGAIAEKPMFGGLAFMLAGNMAVVLTGREELMVRVGADGADEALSQPHASQVVMRGRPMTGWVKVARQGLESEAALAAWIERGRTFTRSLPPKG